MRIPTQEVTGSDPIGSIGFAGLDAPLSANCAQERATRHRRIASPTVLVRRLPWLDCVLEHPDLPWPLTEPAKVGALETPGIERLLFPSRLYRGAAGSTGRHVPLGLPVAPEADRALFVCADLGHDTPTAPGAWADRHGCLWEALAGRHRSSGVVAVVRTDGEFDRTQAALEPWATAPGPGEAGARVRGGAARIERAILRGTPEVLEEFGGLQAALGRGVAPPRQARPQPGRGSIHRGSTWKAVRLSGARFR